MRNLPQFPNKGQVTKRWEAESHIRQSSTTKQSLLWEKEETWGKGIVSRGDQPGERKVPTYHWTCCWQWPRTAPSGSRFCRCWRVHSSSSGSAFKVTQQSGTDPGFGFNLLESSHAFFWKATEQLSLQYLLVTLERHPNERLCSSGPPSIFRYRNLRSSPNSAADLQAPEYKNRFGDLLL